MENIGKKMEANKISAAIGLEKMDEKPAAVDETMKNAMEKEEKVELMEAMIARKIDLIMENKRKGIEGETFKSMEAMIAGRVEWPMDKETEEREKLKLIEAIMARHKKSAMDKEKKVEKVEKLESISHSYIGTHAFKIVHAIVSLTEAIARKEKLRMDKEKGGEKDKFESIEAIIAIKEKFRMDKEKKGDEKDKFDSIEAIIIVKRKSLMGNEKKVEVKDQSESIEAMAARSVQFPEDEESRIKFQSKFLDSLCVEMGMGNKESKVEEVQITVQLGDLKEKKSIKTHKLSDDATTADLVALLTKKIEIEKARMKEQMKNYRKMFETAEEAVEETQNTDGETEAGEMEYKETERVNKSMRTEMAGGTVMENGAMEMKAINETKSKSNAESDIESDTESDESEDEGPESLLRCEILDLLRIIYEFCHRLAGDQDGRNITVRDLFPNLPEFLKDNYKFHHKKMPRVIEFFCGLPPMGCRFDSQFPPPLPSSTPIRVSNHALSTAPRAAQSAAPRAPERVDPRLARRADPRSGSAAPRSGSAAPRLGSTDPRI